METARKQSKGVCDPFSSRYMTQFFKLVGNCMACSNFDDLVNALNNSHNPEEWKHFTDLMKLNLKGAFLLNSTVCCQ